MIVVDASALIHLLLRTEFYEEMAAIIFADGQTLHAPHLIDAEVAQALRRYSRIGDIDDKRGLEALQNLAAFRMTRYPHTTLLPRVWSLRQNIKAYDAIYLALAELLEAPLLTRDLRLRTAASRHSIVDIV